MSYFSVSLHSRVSRLTSSFSSRAQQRSGFIIINTNNKTTLLNVANNYGSFWSRLTTTYLFRMLVVLPTAFETTMSGSPGRKPSLSSPKSKSRAAKKHKFEDVLARATDDGSDAGHDGGGGDDDDEMYVDYSKAEEGDLPKLGSSTFKDQSVSREHSFPFQLHFMLSETEADGLSSVVSWQTHGRYGRIV